MGGSERLVKTMRARFAQEWNYQPDASEIHATLGEIVNAIIEAWKQGGGVGFVDVNRLVDGLPTQQSFFTCEGLASDEMLDALAYELLEQTADGWVNPQVDLACLYVDDFGNLQLYFPFRPDLN